MSDLEPFFNSAEECAAYETFCAEQERGLEKFKLAEPALVCRWRMARRGVPLLNRHIRALSHRVVNGAPLTTNMLSWAKQHVEWSLAAGEYSDPNGVLMLVIDVNGDALMSVGPYEPLADTSRAALIARAAEARAEQAVAAVAPELLGVLAADGHVLLAARADEPLCGAGTLVEQLAATRGLSVERALAEGETVGDFVARVADALTADGRAVVFLVSDEHGVVVEEGAAADTAAVQLSADVRKLFS
ncbi:MAG: hypothetical protein Q4B77_00325 [Coriobacteriaceae bacterium]|nr:hypothetical protein [Coriobacteriaceae bacterium]